MYEKLLGNNLIRVILHKYIAEAEVKLKIIRYNNNKF